MKDKNFLDNFVDFNKVQMCSEYLKDVISKLNKIREHNIEIIDDLNVIIKDLNIEIIDLKNENKSLKEEIIKRRNEKLLKENLELKVTITQLIKFASCSEKVIGELKYEIELLKAGIPYNKED